VDEGGRVDSSTHPWHRAAPGGPGTDELGRALGVPDRDPLADRRAAPCAPDLDVLCAGTVFYDLVFTGLDGPPMPGRELWTAGMGSSPGGVANLAVALRRLGLRTGLAACFSTDQYGDYCWETLADQEGVDLSLSRRAPGWHSPVTVSLAYDTDRAMVTHGHEPPLTSDELVGTPPSARAAMVSLHATTEQWAVQAAAAGTAVFADVGWDATGSWPAAVLDQLEHCAAFLPNHAEAMLYTRTDTPRDALHRLADRVPVAVVTLGPGGAIAVDQTTGEECAVAGVAVDALDATGAGDVFVAGYTTAHLAGWPLRNRVRFGCLTAALAVRHFGGSLSAPGWSDVDAWWRAVRAAAAGGAAGAKGGSAAARLAADYEFLDDVLPPPGPGEQPGPNRAPVTIGFRPVAPPSGPVAPPSGSVCPPAGSVDPPSG